MVCVGAFCPTARQGPSRCSRGLAWKALSPPRARQRLSPVRSQPSPSHGDPTLLGRALRRSAPASPSHSGCDSLGWMRAIAALSEGVCGGSTRTTASVGGADRGEATGSARGKGVGQTAPPGRTVGGGKPNEPVVGGLGREFLPTLFGDDREHVVVCHVSRLGLSPPRHMGQIADLWLDVCHFWLPTGVRG